MCNQHYIRCIKPNDKKRPNLYDPKLVHTQVTYLGLLENVTVRRAGYASRKVYAEFIAAYKCCAPILGDYNPNTKEATSQLLNSLNIKDYTLGKTKVFIRSPKTLFNLEDIRAAFYDKAAALIDNTEQLLYADRVDLLLEGQVDRDNMFIISDRALYIIKDRVCRLHITTDMISGVILPDTLDGFAAIQCKRLENNVVEGQPPLETHWDVGFRNIYKGPLLRCIEMLKNTGLPIDTSRGDTELPAEYSKLCPPLQLQEKPKKRCVVM